MGRKGLHSITLFEILVVVVVCVGFAVFLIRPLRVARQTAVVKPMTDAGAQTGLRDDRSVHTLDATRMPVSEIRIDQIIALPDLLFLNLDHSEITDEDLKPLAESLNLRELNLVGTGLTDGGTKHLAKMHELRLLDARATFLTDDGVAALAPLKKMQILRLGQTWITNTGLATIAAFPNLHILDLRHTQISDDGLPSIAQMKSLKDIRLTGSDVSDEGVADLRIRRPDLNVEFSREGDLSKIVMLKPRHRGTGHKPGDEFHISERPIIQRLKQMGANPYAQNGFVHTVSVTSAEFNDDDLRQLMWCRKLTNITLANPSLTASGWSMIHRNRFLKRLTLKGVTLDAQAAKYLSGSRNLYQLATDGMTDEAMLAFSTRLRTIDCKDSPLTDAGIESISRQRFRLLNRISCYQTSVTDTAADAVEQRVNNITVITTNDIHERNRQLMMARELRQRRENERRAQKNRERIEIEKMVRDAEQKKETENSN